MGKVKEVRLIPKSLFKSWSFSSWGVYSQCPRQAMLGRINKLCPTCLNGKMVGFNPSRCDTCGVSQPMNKAMMRGDMIHRKAEAYLKGETKGLPSELNKFTKAFASLKKNKAQAEADWTLTSDEKLTHAKDWHNAWLRAKIDAHVELPKQTLLIIDFKTGQFNPKHGQGEIYAGVGKLVMPHIKKFVVELWFLDHGKTSDREYTAKEVDELWSMWRQRADAMLADEAFKPKPGEHCKKCPYRSDLRGKGGNGPCDAWKQSTR